jgi:hypothetical protein
MEILALYEAFPLPIDLENYLTEAARDDITVLSASTPVLRIRTPEYDESEYWDDEEDEDEYAEDEDYAYDDADDWNDEADTPSTTIMLDNINQAEYDPEDDVISNTLRTMFPPRTPLVVPRGLPSPPGLVRQSATEFPTARWGEVAALVGQLNFSEAEWSGRQFVMDEGTTTMKW